MFAKPHCTCERYRTSTTWRTLSLAVFSRASHDPYKTRQRMSPNGRQPMYNDPSSDLESVICKHNIVNQVRSLRNGRATKATEFRNALYQCFHRLPPCNDFGSRVFTAYQGITKGSIEILERLDTVQSTHNPENADADNAIGGSLAGPRPLPVIWIGNRVLQDMIPKSIISDLHRMEISARKKFGQ